MMPDNDYPGFSIDDIKAFGGFNSSSNVSFEDFFGLGDVEPRKPGVLRVVLQYVDIYCVPVIALVGLCGNLLSFVVFVGTYMRRMSSSIYLAALSIADIGFLLCVLPFWATHVNVDLYNKNGWCQTLVYLTYVSSFLSVWYVVAFTVERYIAVCFPLRRQKSCTTKRAKCVVIALGVSAAVLYSFGLWTSGVTYPFEEWPVCSPLPSYMTLISILYNIDTVVTLLLPFVAILVMNVRIAYRVVLFYRQRKNLALDSHSFVSLTSGERIVSIRQIPASARVRTLHTRTRTRMTKMLLIVSTTFLALNLPRHTARTYSFVMSLQSEGYQPSENFIIFEKLSQVLYYLHFSVNLFLYSTLGKNFRTASRWLLRRLKHSVCQKMAKVSYCCPWAFRSRLESHLTTTREIILPENSQGIFRRVNV